MLWQKYLNALQKILCLRNLCKIIFKTLYQFIGLDEMEQQEAIWEGVLIADREDEEHKILLYQIDSFYVEVFYHKEYNVIRRYIPFNSTDKLAPYLEKINVQL